MEGIPNLIRRLWNQLSRRRKRQFALVFVMMLSSAALEIASLGAVVPFIAVLVDPAKSLDYPLVGRLASMVGAERPADLVLPLTVGFGLLALTAGAVRLLVLWATTRLSVLTGADLSFEAYRRTLYQPYRVHADRNSSEVISGVLVKVDSVSQAVLQPIQTLGGSALVVVAVVGVLLAIDPVAAISAMVGLGGCYGAVVAVSRKRLARNGETISTERTRVFRVLQEGLGGIREVLLGGTQRHYLEVYRSADVPLRRARAANLFLGSGPRYVMEALAVTMISALAYVYSRSEGGVAAALPVLGALAIGGQRLIPALQQGYSSWATITGSGALIRDAVALLEQPVEDAHLGPDPEPLGLRSEIRFRDVGFRYSEDGPWVLAGLNLTIPKGARVAIVGATGSGKSTILDLLMGLLEPTTGAIEVDGLELTVARRRAWQRSISHVPQHVFLTDASFAENIALGDHPEAIDMDRVRHAAEQASLLEFIESGPTGFTAEVGERGIRLSGGQRQRIGIARALYRLTDLLVLDEATSALDNVTEREVSAAIDVGTPDLTVLIVAHRLSTVEHCDLIVELVDGRVEAIGRYEDLIATSESFRRLALSVEMEA